MTEPAAAGTAKELFVRHARRDGRSVAILRAVDYGDSCVIEAEVYPAGEAPIVAADGRSLARALRVAGKIEPIFAETIDELTTALQEFVRDGDVVITMGAGSIGQVPARLAGAGAE